MSISNKKHFKWILIIWVLSIIAFGISYFVVIAPQSKKIKLADDELKNLTEQIETAKDYASSETTGLLNEQIKNSTATMNDFITRGQDSSENLLEISLISGNLDLGSFNIKPTEISSSQKDDEKAKLVEKKLIVGFISDFRQFASFLNTLERHRPVILIDTFRITRSYQNTKNHDVSMNLIMLEEKNPNSIASATTGASGSAGVTENTDSQNGILQ